MGLVVAAGVNHIDVAPQYGLAEERLGSCTGDARLLPVVLEACERFSPMDTPAREALIAEASAHEPLFV